MLPVRMVSASARASSFAGIALLLLPVLPATASIIRQIPASQVSGQTATGQTIKVWNGYGVSISFYQTGEIIKKIWLDDPSNFVIDVDGCLEGLGKCSGEGTGAGLIHLRRIQTVKIPGLPQAHHGAHLTVITESESSKKSYHFQIVPSSGKPEYSQIEVISSVATSKEEQTKPKADYTALSDSKYIAKGMQTALGKQWITINTPLWGRLTKVVEMRSQGEELTIAATNAGVSMKVVEKLMLLGGKRYIEMPSPKQGEPIETN
jgi:hypothetical protein